MAELRNIYGALLVCPACGEEVKARFSLSAKARMVTELDDRVTMDITTTGMAVTHDCRPMPTGPLDQDGAGAGAQAAPGAPLKVPPVSHGHDQGKTPTPAGGPERSEVPHSGESPAAPRCHALKRWPEGNQQTRCTKEPDHGSLHRDTYGRTW